MRRTDHLYADAEKLFDEIHHTLLIFLNLSKI